MMRGARPRALESRPPLPTLEENTMQFPKTLAGSLALIVLSHGVPAEAEPTRPDSDSVVAKTNRITVVSRPAADEIGPDFAPSSLWTKVTEKTVEYAAPSAQDLSDWLAHYAPYQARQRTDDASAEGL